MTSQIINWLRNAFLRCNVLEISVVCFLSNPWNVLCVKLYCLPSGRDNLPLKEGVWYDLGSILENTHHKTYLLLSVVHAQILKCVLEINQFWINLNFGKNKNLTK